MSAINPLGVPAHQHPNGGGWVADTATVHESAYVGPSARVYGYAQVYDSAQVSGNAQVYGDAQVSGNAWVYDSARVSGDAQVSGNAQVYGDARVEAPRHVLTVGPIGSEDQYATLARTEAGHLLTVGCWRNGTIDDLKAEVMRRAPRCWPEYREVRRLLRLRLAGWDAERAAAAADEAVTA